MDRGKKAALSVPSPKDELAMMSQAFIEDSEELASYFDHEGSDEEKGEDIDGGSSDPYGL